MSQIFISHVEEDESIALEIAHGLEAAGHSTWYYERDSLPGVSYLDQIDEAIEQSQAVVVIISLASLSSWQVDKEVERAHESGKHFVPVLRGVKHIEFQTRKRGWRMAMGVSTSISVPADGASTIVPRIVAGLRRLVINAKESSLSPPVNGQTAAQDVSFSEPADHSVETGLAGLLQSEAVAEPPLVDATPTVSDVDTEPAQTESARQLVIDVPISIEPVVVGTDWSLWRIPALLRSAKTRAGMIVLAVLVVLGFVFYGLSALTARDSAMNSNQAESKKSEPSPGASGQSQVNPTDPAAFELALHAAESLEKSKIDPASSLTGTIWICSGPAENSDEIVFTPNGIFQKKGTPKNGWPYYHSGLWEQNGVYVKFDSSKWTFWELKISPNGNEMNGTLRTGGFNGVSPGVHSVRFTRVH